MSLSPTSPDLDRDLTPRAREVVAAARSEFAAHGYAGATTDAIARRAGVSQPYVVRLFGSKERLFLRCARETQQQIIATHRETAAATDGQATPEQLGRGFMALLAKEPVAVKLMHQINSLGRHPELGEYARTWFAEVYDVVRNECGLDKDAALRFMGRGMLLSTLVSLDLQPGSGEHVDELMDLLGTTPA
ncbi:MAG: TetR/AcrR family transcriptional regulator [Galactobacter sp.]